MWKWNTGGASTDESETLTVSVTLSEDILSALTAPASLDSASPEQFASPTAVQAVNSHQRLHFISVFTRSSWSGKDHQL
jgi:hypothetical protein